MRKALRNIFWSLPYGMSRLVYRARRVLGISDRLGGYDLVLVLFPESRGWILDAICKEIDMHFQGRSLIYYGTSHLPRGRTYFFAHYGVFAACVKRNPFLWGAHTYVFYTHPKNVLGNNEFLFLMNSVSGVIPMCSLFGRFLIEKGVDSARVHWLVGGGADPARFLYHQRGRGVVGFCSAYYERKNPEILLRIVTSMPHRNFILLGRGWREYSRFSEIEHLNNFEYCEVPYDRYPDIYGKMDVFVSVSRLEGGPIPLLEAMMSNVLPVASCTGFAPDIIRHGENGFLFDVDADVDEICRLIDLACENTETNIRATVEQYTWKDFSRKIENTIDEFE